MIILGIPGIIASYILIAILLLYLNLYSKWTWHYKVGGILVTSFFYLVLYFSFPPVLGSPTDENPPPDFRIIGTHVQKPDDPDGKNGVIYLWLARVDASLEIIEPPRAYKLPYTLGLHEKVIGVQAKLDKGVKLLGNLDEESNVPPDQRSDKKQSSSISSKLNFYDLPEIETISKE